MMSSATSAMLRSSTRSRGDEEVPVVLVDFLLQHARCACARATGGGWTARCRRSSTSAGGSRPSSGSPRPTRRCRPALPGSHVGNVRRRPRRPQRGARATSRRRALAEDQRLEQRVRRQAIGAVQPGHGALPRRRRAGDRGPAVAIGRRRRRSSSAPRARRGCGSLRHVDAELEAAGVDRREALGARTPGRGA